MTPQNLSSLQEEFIDRYGVNTDCKFTCLNLDVVKFLNLSELLGNFYGGHIPKEIQDFLSAYISAINNGESFCLNEQDIFDSDYSSILKCYVRCIEKLFFDYCLLKGLSFKSYTLENKLFVDSLSTSFTYDYDESMYNYFIYMFFNPDENFTDITFHPFEHSYKFPLGNGVPLIVPHHSDTYLSWDTSIPVIIMKVKGV